jgi:hypothetical protein
VGDLVLEVLHAGGVVLGGEQFAGGFFRFQLA